MNHRQAATHCALHSRATLSEWLPVVDAYVAAGAEAGAVARWVEDVGGALTPELAMAALPMLDQTDSQGHTLPFGLPSHLVASWAQGWGEFRLRQALGLVGTPEEEAAWLEHRAHLSEIGRRVAEREYHFGVAFDSVLRLAESVARQPGWTCPACGSSRWVAASLDQGRTRIPQCIPCGHYDTTHRTHGSGSEPTEIED